jgi:hypothetical protein
MSKAPHEAQRDSCPDDYGPDWPSTALCSYYRDSVTAGYVQSWLGEDAQYLKKGQYIEGPYVFDLSEVS